MDTVNPDIEGACEKGAAHGLVNTANQMDTVNPDAKEAGEKGTVHPDVEGACEKGAAHGLVNTADQMKTLDPIQAVAKDKDSELHGDNKAADLAKKRKCLDVENRGSHEDGGSGGKNAGNRIESPEHSTWESIFNANRMLMKTRWNHETEEG